MVVGSGGHLGKAVRTWDEVVSRGRGSRWQRRARNMGGTERGDSSGWQLQAKKVWRNVQGESTTVDQGDEGRAQEGNGGGRREEWKRKRRGMVLVGESCVVLRESVCGGGFESSMMAHGDGMDITMYLTFPQYNV